MRQFFEDLYRDLALCPVDFEKAENKLNCVLQHGKRIRWYFQEDLDFAKETGESPREAAPYGGILVAKEDLSLNRNELDFDECILIMDLYPTEKEDCEASWMAVGKLLDASNLIEVFDEDREWRLT